MTMEEKANAYKARVAEMTEAAYRFAPNNADARLGFRAGVCHADAHPAPNLVDIDEFLKKARIYLINKGMVHSSVELDEFDKTMKGE